MADCFVEGAAARTATLHPLTRAGFDEWLRAADKDIAAWVRATGYEARPGRVLPLPPGASSQPYKGKKGDKGKAGVVWLAGIDGDDDLWSWGAIAGALPGGRYRIAPEPEAATANRAALGWGLGCYVFDRYKASSRKIPSLVWPENADRQGTEAAVDSTYLVRDLINTPAEDMGPGELAEAARRLAREFKAKTKVTVGDNLLRDNFPAIHAVGRASVRPPRLIDLSWGRASDPKVTVVGKGVCFDTGGLDLKPAGGMKLMKKDMGGAAIALGLARMVMAAGLPVRLRVLIPAVENSVSGDSYRPLDVIRTRKGLTVEIGNTDAEGRVVLSDALALACTEKPAVVLDFATLTGAARVALGTGLPAMFANDDDLAADFTRHGEATGDPVWRLPLWQPYRTLIDSKVADLNNTGSVPQGGAITAALFLEAFVDDGIPWAHFDVMAWNASSSPGRPEGGEAMAMRAAFAVLAARYARA